MRRLSAGEKRCTHLQTVTWSTKSPRSARSSSTSRYDSEKRKYQPTASRIISGSNCRHLKRPETEGVSRSIEQAYQITPAKLQHFPFDCATIQSYKVDFKRSISLPNRPLLQLSRNCRAQACNARTA